MLFNSLEFLVFLPLFALAYFATSGRLRMGICLTGSYLFYGWWDWRFLGLLGGVTLSGYFLALGMEPPPIRRKRKGLLVLALAVNLGLLGTFKYLDFFLDSCRRVLHPIGWAKPMGALEIILPIGISFYIFQNLAYVIDVYRGKVQPEGSLLRFATFLAFFPQLVAGPIMRADRFLSQLYQDQPAEWNRCLAGAGLALWGFFKKVVIADSLALVVDNRFAHPEAHTSFSLALGVIFYSFQIYCDFSGYSDIAIGLARIFGFDFGINFHRPYFSTSFRDFWSRWHISLSTWLRDYLYIPLGGNRRGGLHTLKNLMITMLLGGLWHGASWNFAIWGGLHGIFLAGERLVRRLFPRLDSSRFSGSFFPRFLTGGTVFLAVSFAWIFFRASSLDQAFFIIEKIFSFDSWSWTSVPGKFLVVKGVGLIMILVLLEAFSSRISFTALFQQRPLLRLAAATALLWFLVLFGSFGAQPFIYFRF